MLTHLKTLHRTQMHDTYIVCRFDDDIDEKTRIMKLLPAPVSKVAGMMM